MRIPVYTAPGGVTTEAPGRSLNVRMNAQPFVAAAQAEGSAFRAAADAANQYAMTRYKVLTENQLNEALLGAEETLRTRADELVQSQDYSRALDGDDPIWTRETQEMREALRDRVGGNEPGTAPPDFLRAGAGQPVPRLLSGLPCGFF